MIEQVRHSMRYATQFGSAVQFFVLHDYYNGLACPDFTFRPTADTLLLIRNFRMKYRSVANGFEMALDLNHDFDYPMYEREQVFSFVFENRNPLFLQFTDMPFMASKLLQFDSNNVWDERLHEGESVNPALFLDSNEDGIQGVIHIRHTPEKPLWGKNRANYRYYIRFQNRKVKIRYIFYGNQDLVENFSTFRIEGSDELEKHYIFTAAEPYLMRNGDTAFSCTSVEELPLKNVWKNPLVVKRARGNGSPFDYRKVLPFPRPEGVKFDEILTSFVSDVFVKL